MEQETNLIKPNIFEEAKRIDENGYEFWYARELMVLLEYTDWRNFYKVIQKAITALSLSYPQIEDHFVELNKKITIGTGTHKETTRQIIDYKLSRRACYLIAQNGDPSKLPIANAQNYFAQQTRKQEVRDIKEKDIERILARKKLTESEKKFAGVMSSHGVDGKGIAEIKSAGDEALFDNPTRIIKDSLGIKQDSPLADHLPTISIKAKDLATEMTTYKTIEKDLQGTSSIRNEHQDNNAAVRNMLIESGIYPERLPAEEDIKKLERKYSAEEIREIFDHKLLQSELIEIDIRGINDETELYRIKTLIDNNQGDSKLFIYYGSHEHTLTIERDIQINAEVINGLRNYLIISEKTLMEDFSS